MGGRPKGLLRTREGETLIARSDRIAREAGLHVVLVGNIDVYDTVIQAPRISDPPEVSGPLAGLHAILLHAQAEHVIALACDMPYVSVSLLQRLMTEHPEADVLAPRSSDGQKWEPLFARYCGSGVRPMLAEALAHGERSFQDLFARLHVVELPLSETERAELRDWDTPRDIES